MKKLSPDYFGWAFLLLLDIIISLLLLWGIDKGLSREPQYRFDWGGYSFAFAMGVFLIWQFYEMRILFQFLFVELSRTIIYDEEKQTLIVVKDGQSTLHRLSELREVIYSNGRSGSRTPTAHLSYTELLFNHYDSVLITSFTMNVAEIQNFLVNHNFKKSTRTRTLFEGIKRRLLATKMK